MTENDVSAAITNDSILQNGTCEDNGNCTIGETDDGNDGDIILDVGDNIKQGDATTRTSSSSKSAS